MANVFNFQMDESFLKAYLEYVQLLKRDHPDEELVVQISVDLYPDGTGFEASHPQISVVDVKQQESHTAGQEWPQNESGE